MYDWDGTGTLANDGVLLDTDTVSEITKQIAADNIILDLTNDNETLGAVKGVNLGNGNSTIATTTANIYIGGTQKQFGLDFLVQVHYQELLHKRENASTRLYQVMF